LVIKQGAQPILRNCQLCDTPDLRLVVSLCDRYPVVGCDSSLHHASKAFGKKAVVLWAGTDQERYGYKSNINMREYPFKAFTPMRLPMNSFDLDISNQGTNNFTKGFIDKALVEVKNNL
jgi:ADP-heptose:LPS heptosyltransferase